jgi:phosphoglycolate phosphatase
MPIHAGLLFDKDGTLFDFHRSWSAWAHSLIDTLADGVAGRRDALARALQYDYEDRAFHPDALSVSGTVREQAEILSPALPDWTTDRIEVFLKKAAATALMVPATPLVPLLDGFRAAGLRLGVATNDAESAARTHLEGAEILEKFDYIAGYDSGYGAKPEPGMCTGFAQAMDLDPAACVMIGDSLHDLVAGRAAGMATVAVLTGLAGAELLAPHADVVLPDLSALPGWLATQV